MTAVQLHGQTDLLEHLALFEAETIPGDLVCPHCRHQTAGALDFRINHGGRVRCEVTGEDMCLSMHLSRNHVIAKLDHTPAPRPDCAKPGYTRKDLERDIDLAVMFWGERARAFVPAYHWPKQRKENQ